MSPKTYQAFLFDMDGTILNSNAAVERIWRTWAVRHGLDPEALLPTIHGIRSVDTVRHLNLPGVDPEAEAAAIMAAEIEDTRELVPIGGAVEFLKSLPPEAWAIVTSASLALATARLKATGLPLPAVIVTAEDVTAGKPDPSCYRIAAQRLDVDVHRCLVFEDADAGICAAEVAGADVIVITEAHPNAIDTPHVKLSNYEGIRPWQTLSGTLGLASKVA